MTPAEKAVYDRAYRAKNKARIAEAKRAYALANFEREQARVKAWVEANRERSAEIKKAWKDRNPDAERNEKTWARKRAYMKVYAKEHPEVFRRNASLRARGISHATPPWADRAAIKAIYVKARSEGLHVDHIVPLRGRDVCGLHVHNNLQLLTPRKNRSKGNRHAG